MGNLELRIMCACISHSIVGSDLNRYHNPHYTMLLCQTQAQVMSSSKSLRHLTAVQKECATPTHIHPTSLSLYMTGLPALVLQAIKLS